MVYEGFLLGSYIFVAYLHGSQNQGSVEAELIVDATDPLSDTP